MENPQGADFICEDCGVPIDNPDDVFSSKEDGRCLCFNCLEDEENREDMQAE